MPGNKNHWGESVMKIITWNCNKGFRNKVKLISQHKPDIAVIQECENINEIIFDDTIQPFNKYHYALKNIGIGLLSYTNYQFNPFNINETYIKLDLGIQSNVTGPINFQLLGLWTGPHKNDESIHYVNSVITFLEKYGDWVKKSNTIILGDFNSNATYDLKLKKPHLKMLNLMDDVGLCSAYHEFFNEEQGKETRSTFYLYRKNESKQHIDHIFIPKKLKNNIKSIEIGKFDDWSAYSDHMPFIMDIDM